MPKAFKKCIFQRTKHFPKLGVSGEAKDCGLRHTSSCGWIPSLVCSTSRHAGIQIVLCAFTDFPRVLLTFPNSIHGPSDALFPFFSQPPEMCVPTFCIADSIFIFGTGESLCWLQIYYLCFPGVIPITAVSDSSLSHYFFLSSPSATSASKTHGDSELSMLFAHPHHKKSFPTVFTLCNGKKQERILFCVVSSPRWQKLTYYETSSSRQRGERVQGTPKIQECICVHTHLNIQ